MCYLPRKEKVATTEGAGKMGQIRKGLEHHTQTQDFYRFLYFVFAYFNFTFPTFFFLLRLSSARPEDMIIKWKICLSN